MRIILWPSSYLPNIGGLETLTHALAKELQKNGHEILVLSTNMSSEILTEINIDNTRICLFPFTFALCQSKLKLIKIIIARAQQIITNFNPDLINIHGWYESFCFYQMRVISATNIPLCITVHGLLEQKHYHTPECLKLWSKARAVNTVSHALLQALNASAINHPNARVIYNGISMPTLPILTPERENLVMIGRISKEKCFDIAFYAIKKLIKKYPNLKLFLVGGGPDFHKLVQLKNDLALAEHIMMTDFVRPNQVIHYLDQASMVLIPSYYESFSLVAVEAAMRQRAVIASNVHGLKEVVQHEQTGLLIAPNNPSELAQAIDTLLSQPEKLATMGMAAYQRANNLFTIEKTTQNYLQMYQNILE